ncbi:DUF1501 domain-containing protein [Fimbriiglobus ruber]|uniref:DUF1501 domain-containing protein n=1 Tax=Fimbriiglobus ruber TaxID=1908690 RepID=A0A225DWU2_9BACT|nr:DUF1501 domain-containing protein [Fimbriiglobus ruber]OWK42948.1 hypothetical protein FRUB_02547 [Fimbriiglobus ruber]
MSGHTHAHAFSSFNAHRRDGLVLPTRRNVLKAGLAGVAGLTAPALLQHRATAAGTRAGKKSVILLWMTGGPSQIDTFDPKPDRPPENRGPFGVTQTKLPGVLVCEHLPKLAGMLDRFTVIRSVDSRHSNHEPNTVMMTANPLAEPRTNPEARNYPAIASLVGKFHGPNHPAAPPYAAFYRSRTHLAFGGYLGKQYDPFSAGSAAKLPVYDLVGKDTGQVSAGDMFDLPTGVTADRLSERQSLTQRFDRIRADIDSSGTMSALDQYGRRAVEMLTSGRVRDALDLAKERPATRDAYGKHLWCQQALAARRLVEAGCAFVTLDLSYHTASGTWDNHGDNIPPYGGIKKGLGPLLPLFDRLVTTLVTDLTERGLIDDVLVIAMGEFGRTPNVGTQGSTDGRNHWPYVMSMLMAGGGLKHAQVIGSTDKEGGQIRERPVSPGDLAATIYRYFGVPLDSTYQDATGRPHNLLPSPGEPMRELF